MTFISDSITDKEEIVTDSTDANPETFESEGSASEGDLYSFEYPESNPDWYPDEEDYKAFDKNTESTEHAELDTQIIDNNEERNVSNDEENENTLINELVTTLNGEFR